MRLWPIEHLEKPQNAYTRKTAYTFFVVYNWSTKKTKPTVLFETELKPNPRFFQKPNLENPFRTSLIIIIIIISHTGVTLQLDTLQITVEGGLLNMLAWQPKNVHWIVSGIKLYCNKTRNDVICFCCHFNLQIA